MHSRTDVLNHLIERHNLKRFLEIGVQNPAQNFDKIRCEYKVSVDPDLNADATYCMTSDRFFEDAAYGIGYNDNQFSIIFLDGLHSAEQLEKDFFNCLKYLSPNGWVVMHDTNPSSEDLTHFPRDKKGTWNGSCYKFAARLKSKNYFTVDIDHGVSVYRKVDGVPLIKNNSEITWEYFDAHRKELLNLISFDEFVKL